MLVFAIAPDKLVGWTRALRPNEARFFDERYARLPELGRRTGRGNTAKVELVLQAKPGQVQAQTGIRYELLRLMGNEREAKALASWYDNELTQTRKLLSRTSSSRRVYYRRGPAGLQTGGKGSINVEVLEFLWDPEVILTTDPNFAQLALRDPRWRSVSAVQRRRVYLAPQLPFGWFDFPPGANRLLGIWWAAKLPYPEAFDVDLRAKVAEFHRRLYHRDPTPAQLDSLLAQ